MVESKVNYIASIDLLGIKNVIRMDDNDEHLNRIHNIYQSWLQIYRDDSWLRELQIKIFSDNIVIAIPETAKDAAEKLLEFVSYMCIHFLEKGYKPRGGICKGRIFIDHVFVWGKGLLHAYEMESKEAFYPRILVDEEIIHTLSPHVKKQLILRDKDDNKMYLNYIQAFGDNAQGRKEKIDRIRIWLEAEIQKDNEQDFYDRVKNEDQAKILAKLLWLRNYLDLNEKIIEERQA